MNRLREARARDWNASSSFRLGCLGKGTAAAPRDVGGILYNSQPANRSGRSRETSHRRSELRKGRAENRFFQGFNPQNN